jgi:YbbR domain-containing protein
MKRWVLNNLGFKIFSLILAIGLWFYIHGEITKVLVQKTFEGIPIRLVANREKLLLANYQLKITPQKIDVLLRGEKSQIEKVRKNDLKALVDISDISGEGIYNLPVKILLPENIEAVDKQINPSACQVVIRGFEVPAE